MSWRFLLAALAVALVATSLTGGVALGAPTASSVEISVIHATRTDGGVSIDPQLRDLPQLTKQQPFVRYNAFRLLDRKQLTFERGKPVVYALVDGRTLQVTLVEEADAGQKGGERYHVRAEIAGPGKKEFLKLLEVTAGRGDPFFVGGQSYQGGTLFLEFVIRE
jgi:hypothetical protein